jgi:hypothetical protein
MGLLYLYFVSRYKFIDVNIFCLRHDTTTPHASQKLFFLVFSLTSTAHKIFEMIFADLNETYILRTLPLSA